MLEKLESLVRENSGEAILNNKEIPEEKNSAAIQAASSSITDSLKKGISSGGLSGLTDIFNQGATEDNPAVNDATTDYMSKLQGLGINSESAKRIASSIIPLVFAKLTGKVNDPNDQSFDVKSLWSSITGGVSSQAPDVDSDKDEGSITDRLKGLF